MTKKTVRAIIIIIALISTVGCDPISATKDIQQREDKRVEERKEQVKEKEKNETEKNNIGDDKKERAMPSREYRNIKK